MLVACALVVLGACTSADPSTTAETVQESSTTAPSSSTTGETTTTTEAPPETTLPAGTEDLPREMREEIAALIAATEEVRGLAFLQPPRIVVVSEEELEMRVRESLQEDIEDLGADEALLKLLGLLADDIDLLELYLDLYGEQVAGYYDGETGELVVPAGDSFSELQKATLVHELTHALTDQRFGFNDAYEALIDEHRFDEAVAMLAVIEGDATLTELLYIQQLDVSQQRDLLSEMFGTDSTVFDSVPVYLQNSLIFPYQAGLAFVQRFYEIGGFDEVNRLYVEPPVSSEQIINPRDYQSDMPIPVETVAPAVSGYEVVYESTWGELSFDLMFDQVLGGADEASDGWGGDAYTQWYDGTDAALLLVYTGDTEADVTEMREALVRYAPAAMAVEPELIESDGGVVFEGDDFAFVRVSEGRLYFVAAGDPAVGRQIVASLP
jgi:hypothetical protein